MGHSLAVSLTQQQSIDRHMCANSVMGGSPTRVLDERVVGQLDEGLAVRRLLHQIHLETNLCALPAFSLSAFLP